MDTINEIAKKHNLFVVEDCTKTMGDHGSAKKYYHEIYGHNYRLEGIQGAVLNVKLIEFVSDKVKDFFIK
jgi:dTDP-4-amino-4,6-dideoxygalactose transaminase